MPKIELRNISKKFLSISNKNKKEIITAVDDVSLKIEKNSYNTLLGPSGCGKTTLLRIIAGLEMPDKGKIFFDDTNVTGFFPEQRKIGFVFQNYSLFPHMDVWHNVSYGPMIRNFPKKEIEEIVSEVLKMVKLDHRLTAYPNELSGGMQQRVAVARALATKSPIMLLDEPLGALDVRIGTALRYDLVNLIKKYRLTAIHVTHNQEEAMTISDNVIMMKKGRIIQYGPPKEIYDKPNSIFSAYFLGHCNFLQCTMVDENHARFKDAVIELPKSNKKRRIVIGVRPEKIHLETNLKKENIPGIIEFIDFLGDRWQYTVRVSEDTQIRVLKRSSNEFRIGERVSISFNPSNILIFEEPKDFKEEKSLI